MKIERPQSKQPIPQNAKCVFNGQLFDVYQWEQEMYDGTTKVFEKIKRPDTVVIFPILPDGRILLTKQKQPGREAFIDAPSGRVDQDEDVLDAAKRELLEETGYTADTIILWKSGHMTAKIDWVGYTFVAKNIKKISEQNLDNGENIENYIVTFEELLNLTENENFRAYEIIPDLLRAKIDLGKYNQLKELFKPE